MTCSSSCDGRCCAVFCLPHTIRQLRQKAAAGALEDGAFIAAMVIPLTPNQARERAAEFGTKLEARWEHRGHHFACRHWDEETRLCTVYEQRPTMCRDFPYGRGCHNEGCSFEVPETELSRVYTKE